MPNFYKAGFHHELDLVRKLPVLVYWTPDGRFVKVTQIRNLPDAAAFEQLKFAEPDAKALGPFFSDHLHSTELRKELKANIAKMLDYPTAYMKDG